MRNDECGMMNAECGMGNAEFGIRNAEWGMRNNYDFVLLDPGISPLSPNQKVHNPVHAPERNHVCRTDKSDYSAFRIPHSEI
ncbi:MAG TPA: hypothetical protein VGK99_13250 [Acidobacteriota bacterium]